MYYKQSLQHRKLRQDIALASPTSPGSAFASPRATSVALGDGSPGDAGGMDDSDGGGTGARTASEFWADRRRRGEMRLPARAELLPSQVMGAVSSYPRVRRSAVA